MDFEKLTLDCVINTIARRYSDRTAIIFDDRKVSYEQLLRYSKRLAVRLWDIGIRKDHKVAIILPNCIEYLYVYFALFLIGAWGTPINTRYEPGELRNVIKDSDANTVIYKDFIGVFDYNKILFELKEELPLIRNFILFSREQKSGTISLEALIYEEIDGDQAGFNMEWDSIQPDDVALLAYTSGTTGSPKGVMIPHRSLVLTSLYCGQIWEVDCNAGFSVAPLYAAQGFLAVLIDLVSGVTMKWISTFNPNDIMSEIIKKDINVFHTQPTMWSILLSMPYFKFMDFSHLNKVIVSGSLCSSDLAKRIQDTVGCTLLNAYGLIEATGVTTLTHPDDAEDIRLNTVGRPIPGVEIKIVNGQRQEVKKGEIGELAVRGYIMKGYYKNRQKTNEVIDDEGWLYTGDLACYHEDGENIRIVGRCKDMVIRGGFNVYPIDIEECLLKFDKIEDAAVVGKPDDIMGEKLVAFLIPKPSVDITAGEVMGFCRGKIANYKVPDEVHFVSQFPILLSGKVQKNVLKEWAQNGIPAENKLLFDGRTVSKAF